MLSRLTTKAVASPWARPSQRLLSTTNSNNAEERDLVNFPRRKRLVDPAPVRHGWVPEGWMKFFYPKTGVTGPYVFAATVGTYLVSKEIWVLEHEFYAGLGFATVMAILVKNFGPSVAQTLDEAREAEEAKLGKYRLDEIQRCADSIKQEESAQWMATSYQELIQAKKEAVGLQLEAAYRERLHEAYSQVKKRLDYQLEVSNVLRRSEQKHMVEWILSNVRKSISAKQEEDALKKCIADLKAMA